AGQTIGRRTFRAAISLATMPQWSKAAPPRTSTVRLMPVTGRSPPPLSPPPLSPPPLLPPPLSPPPLSSSPCGLTLLPAAVVAVDVPPPGVVVDVSPGTVVAGAVVGGVVVTGVVVGVVAAVGQVPDAVDPRAPAGMP